MPATNLRPIIIKRRKVVGGDGHHGGAWKVAYADFVTAMMAFFLLLWLVSSTTESERRSLADYFSPTISVARDAGGGDAPFGGESLMSERTAPKEGVGATDVRHDDSDRSAGRSGTDPEVPGAADGTEFEEVLSTLDAAMQGLSGESMVSDDLLRHIVTRVTDEGLVVELSDLPDARLFEAGGARPTPLMRRLTGIVASVFARTENMLAINAHVSAVPVVRREDPVWELSGTRAQASRQLMLHPDFGDDRIARVSSFADRVPALANTMDPRNNRIELILLR